MLLPEIERQQAEGKSVTFRADAAFAKPEIYEALEERGVSYVIRIPANRNLELEIEDILFRPPGRPSLKPLVRFYNKRGTAEQWIKEGKQATSWTRLSCHRFRANEVRLQLAVLAYNLGNLWRRLGLPQRIKN